MTKSHWFASLLTNSEGVWSGRFPRPADATRVDAEALAAIQQWAAAAHSPEAPVILPAPAPASVWAATDGRAAGRLVSVRLAGARIDLNTAVAPDWSFGAAGASAADLGWLLNRPVAGGRQRSPVQLVKLLADIERDADTRELEEAFRADPTLSYQLLRLLNSAAIGRPTPVRSLGHAIDLLGRRQLQRWLQLLIYAQPEKPATAPNPLLQLAAYRGLLLEGLVRQAGGANDDADAAYMTGIFSLLDRVIAEPLALIVRQLPLETRVAAALADGAGEFGDWLGLAVAAERGDLAAAADALARRGVTPDDWRSIQEAAYRWAASLGKCVAVAA
ncbi:MAG TPA: HDOD domain-containing protein [Rhodocyclaceae bacterium]|nr:HDOD domain-containing protein [Rhodocyclaceae bacterium]